MGLLHDAGRFPQLPRLTGPSTTALSVDHRMSGPARLSKGLWTGESSPSTASCAFPYLTGRRTPQTGPGPAEGLDGTALVLASLVRDARQGRHLLRRPPLVRGRRAENSSPVWSRREPLSGLWRRWDREGRLTHRHIRTLSDFPVLQLSGSTTSTTPRPGLLVERGNWTGSPPDCRRGTDRRPRTVERARSRMPGPSERGGRPMPQGALFSILVLFLLTVHPLGLFAPAGETAYSGFNRSG